MLSRTGHVQAAGFCFVVCVCLFNTHTHNTSYKSCDPSAPNYHHHVEQFKVMSEICFQLCSAAGSHWGFKTLHLIYNLHIFTTTTMMKMWPFSLERLKKHCSGAMMATGRQEGVMGVWRVTRGEAQDLSPFIRAHNRFQELCFRGAATSYRETTCFCLCFTSRQMRELAGK